MEQSITTMVASSRALDGWWRTCANADIASRSWGDGAVIHVLPANDTHRLSSQAATVLTALLDGGPVRVRRLAELSGQSGEDVLSILHDLAALGLVIECSCWRS